jgi:hypothetical protein
MPDERVVHAPFELDPLCLHHQSDGGVRVERLPTLRN